MNFEQSLLLRYVVAFNRPYHLSETLLALSKNYLLKNLNCMFPLMDQKIKKMWRNKN